MGLFSTKKKTHVNTSVSRMVADEDIIPSSKMAILDYTLSSSSASTRVNAESITDYLLRAGANNIVARAKKARIYAGKSSYYYGLPVSNLVSQDGVDIQGAVQDELEAIYPEGVIVKDAYFGPMNNFYFLKPILQNKYNYNYDTNELESESLRVGFKCYMESAVIKYSKYSTEALVDPDALKQVGLSAEAGYTPFRPANPKAPQVPWIENYEGDYDIAEVTVVYADAQGAKVSYKLIIDYLDYEPSSKPPEDGLDESDTDNIEPDAVAPDVTTSLIETDYYQANYEYTEAGVTKSGTFIYAYGSGLSSRLENLFKVVDQFGMHIPKIYARLGGKACNREEMEGTPEYKSMTGLCRYLGMDWSSWVDEIHKSVGSVGDVKQIYMTYALPANTEDKLIIEYMYEYFMGLYGRIPNKFAQSMFTDNKADIIASGAKQGQSIQIADKGSTQQISFSSIGYRDIRGSIGEVGTVTSGRETYNVISLKRGWVRPATSSVTVHCYRKQLTATTYREVRVQGLATTTYVQGGHKTVAKGNSENLLIPLDLAVNHEFNNRQKEELYTKSMYIVLNTLKVVKQKWYQTGIFKAIMFVIAVVIGFFFPPAGVAAMTWLAAVYAVVISVVVNIVISVAVKLLVSLGIDVGAAAAILAIVALIVGGGAAIGNISKIAGVTTQQLMVGASHAFSMSSQGYALQTANAIKEHNSLMVDLSKEQKELQDKARELGIGQSSTLLMFEPPLSIGIKIGESPDDYYDRSIRVNNLAGVIYSLTESYVDTALTLPTSNQILSNMQEYLDELSISRV